MKYVRTHISCIKHFSKCDMTVATNIDKKHDQFILEFFSKRREMALVPERNFGNRLWLLVLGDGRREGMNKKQEMRPKL